MHGDRRVGRYHLVERLAVGGMAEIFLACEKGSHNFERLVVIKKMLPALAEDEAFVQMFLLEARTQAQVTHPNVVQIHELGEADGQPYMVMEYVAGSTLRQLLQAAIAADAEVPVEVALDLAMQACAGAHAIHELRDTQGNPLGLVHRDLTPHNLMVTDEGFLKLLDFGIVKATIEQDVRTRTGVLKGKIAYVSPEQCMQENLDRRSDIFTLGNVTWELLSRDKLFRAQNEVGVMQAIITGNVRDLREVRPDVPAPVVHAIERALAPRRDSRYDTADEMRRALVEAAAAADLVIDRDRTAAFVRETLGERHATRKKAVEEALDRTLVTLSPMVPSDAPSVTGQTAVTRVGVLSVVGAVLAGLLGGVLVVSGIALVLAGVLDPSSLGVGSTRHAVDDYVPPQGVPMTLEMAPTLDEKVLLKEWEPLRRYLEQRMNRPLHLEVAGSYEEASKKLTDGQAEFAVLPPYILLKTLDRARGKVEPLVTKIYEGSSGFDGLILTNDASHATSIHDLVGDTICYSDPNSTTGYVFPRLWIREQGLDPDTDFEAHVSGNHMQVLKDLIDNVCQVGGTYTGNYTTAGPTVPVSQLRVLGTTGHSPHDAIAAGPTADADLRQRMTQALLAFDPNKELGRKQLGDHEQITGFRLPDAKAFERLRKGLRLEKATAMGD